MKNLINIQYQLKAPKSRKNTYGGYNYRSAEDILTAVKPLLEKYGCTMTISDEIVQVGERIYVKASVTISDDTETKTVTAFARANYTLDLADSQITGTASSYARKYALNGLFLIDDIKDADTDEYHAQTGDIATQPIGTTKAKVLEARCDREGVDYAKVCALLKVSRFEDITEYNHSLLIKEWDKWKERCKKDE